MAHIITGDCIDVMAGMEPESVDAIVTDPPYGLSFMSKEWDRLDGVTSKPGIGERPTEWISLGDDFAGYNPTCATCGSRARGVRKCECSAPDWRIRGKALDGSERQSVMQDWHQAWAAAALRVAKPGAYLLAFGGTRTYHRLACAIEDAGWIIRESILWGSWLGGWVYAQGFPKSRANLKPAWEPIVMARKPGPLRELDIEGCRIGTTKDTPASPRRAPQNATYGDLSNDSGEGSGWDPNVGRWPANVMLTDPIFDGGWDGVVGGGEAVVNKPGQWTTHPGSYSGPLGPREPYGYGDTGTYSRFFLIPKASRGDREPLLPGQIERRPFAQSTSGRAAVTRGEMDYEAPFKSNGLDAIKHRENTHPTVKPLELMRHLVRLVTPQGGTVLDPFLGSGTTGLAAEQEGFDWVGIEREAEYVAIAEARLALVQRGLGL